MFLLGPSLLFTTYLELYLAVFNFEVKFENKSESDILILKRYFFKNN